MNIIIVTGAAGGIGKEFVRQLKNEKGIDEIWVIGRTEAKLQALKDEFGDKIVPYAVDVTDDASMMAFQDVLKEKNPTVKCSSTAPAPVRSISPARTFPGSLPRSAPTASAISPCAISASLTSRRVPSC